IGSKPWWMLTARVLPNVASPIIVQASLALGGVLIAEATLSFLGIGVQPPKSSWGLMLTDAYPKIFVHPWQVVYPGVAIAFNVLGDGVRDAFSIDTVRRRRKGKAGITRVALETPVLGADDASVPDDALLAIQGLSVEFETEQGVHRVVENVSLHVRPGEIL